MERARHLCPLLALGVPGRVNRHSRGDRSQCRETDRRADEYATGLLAIPAPPSSRDPAHRDHDAFQCQDVGMRRKGDRRVDERSARHVDGRDDR